MIRAIQRQLLHLKVVWRNQVAAVRLLERLELPEATQRQLALQLILVALVAARPLGNETAALVVAGLPGLLV